MDTVRINKYIAEQGYCSRREADRLIEAGKVFINDKKAELGDRVAHGDSVRVEGRDKKTEPPKVYILLNKPVGLIVTTDTTKKDNVINYIDYPERIFPVGRLDVKSEGLLLLTNDGTLANRIMHPRYEHDKEYVIEVDRPMPRSDINKLQHGIELEDGVTAPAQVRQMEPTKFAIILKEGRNRQIRRMVEALDYEVVKLKRTRILTLKLVGSFPAGKWRQLTEKEVRDLKKMVGMDVPKVKTRPKKKRNIRRRK